LGQLHDNFKLSVGKIVTALEAWIANNFAAQVHTHSEFAPTNHTHTIANIDDIEVISLAEYNALAVKDNKIYICLE
jgi:hypothetical protein